MDQVVAALRQQASSADAAEGVVVHNCRALSFFHTYQGIDLCGLRLRDDIFSFVASHNAQAAEKGDSAISRISFVGYSAGGLFCRYCIALLHRENFFKAVQPSHFVTIATPHLGTRWASRRASGRIMNAVAGCVVGLYAGRTGQQLYFVDGGGKPQGQHRILTPLLLEMADQDGSYFAALALFPHIYVYANVSNDNTVPYCTSSLSHYNKWKAQKEEKRGGDSAGRERFGDTTAAGDDAATGGSGGSKSENHDEAENNIRSVDPGLKQNSKQGLEKNGKQEYILEVIRVSADAPESLSNGPMPRPQLEGAAPPREENACLAAYTLTVIVLLFPLALVHFILIMLPIKLISVCYARPDSSRLLPRAVRDVAVDADAAPWIALRALRALHIHRVSVFIPGGHTHGRVICRFKPNEGGLEVVRHIAENVLYALGGGGNSIAATATVAVANGHQSGGDINNIDARLGVDDVGLCEEDDFSGGDN
jgi:hypothetical protein